jgi:hypothetical protein
MVAIAVDIRWGWSCLWLRFRRCRCRCLSSRAVVKHTRTCILLDPFTEEENGEEG